MTHPNADVLRRMDDAFNQGDFDAALALFSGDCVVHVPGRSKLAGDYRGRDEFGRLMGMFMEAVGGELEFETHAVLADDEHGVMLHKMRATKNGQPIEVNTVNVFHLADGKITEMWTIDDNQYEADAFYDS